MICLGSFPDHESAGYLMTDCVDSDKCLKGCLNVTYDDEATFMDHREVADLIDTQYVPDQWQDHETAKRSSQERDMFNY